MKMRPLIPSVGAPAWVEASKSHPLPSGVVDRTPVTVTAVDGHRVTVRDASGREWKLIERQVDCGSDYCGPAGNWMHESKRQVLDALERQMERHRLSPRLEGLAGAVHDECESRLRWVLERNGRRVARLGERGNVDQQRSTSNIEVGGYTNSP